MFLKTSRNPEAGPAPKRVRKPHPVRNGVLATLLCFLAVAFLSVWVWDLLEPFTGDYTRPASELVFELPAGLLIYWYLRRKRPAETIQKLPKRSVLLVAAAFALLVCFPCQMFYRDFHEVIQPGVTSSVNDEVAVVLVLEVLVLAPILEEILFRGVFFGITRRFMSFWPSAILNTALFALMHISNPLEMTMTVYLAVISMALYERTGYLRYGMILHALYNWSGPILLMAGIQVPQAVSAVLLALSVVLFLMACMKREQILDWLMSLRR